MLVGEVGILNRGGLGESYVFTVRGGEGSWLGFVDKPGDLGGDTIRDGT